VPAAIPLTRPVFEPTVASNVLLLVHVPPPELFVSVVVAPTHTVLAPPIVAGEVFTVTLVTAKQPEGTVYVMSGVPAETPLTAPLPAPTVASPVFELLHTPPPVPLANIVVRPVQTTGVPVLAAGVVFTVIGNITKQPAGNVYDILGVPAVTPVTTPVLPTAATPELLLLHVPPDVVSVSAVVVPVQTVLLPVIALGDGLTVIVVVVKQPVPIV